MGWLRRVYAWLVYGVPMSNDSWPGDAETPRHTSNSGSYIELPKRARRRRGDQP